MKNIFRNVRKAHIIMCLFVMLISSCKLEKKTTYYKLAEATNINAIQRYYSEHLDKCILALDKLNKETNLIDKVAEYKVARKEFKLIEPILAFTDKENYKSLNAPNILKVEEEDATNIKVKKPFGFQVIEELLYEKERDIKRLEEIVNTTKNRLLLVANNNKLYLKKHHILWLIRDQIARIALVGITGFDSPVLEQSLLEANTNYTTLEFVINTYDKQFSNRTLLKDLSNDFKKSQTVLKGSFTTFDRYNFIKKHTHNQLKLLKEIAKDWKVTFPLTLAFNNNITSLFSKETFNKDFFSDYHQIEMKNFEEKVVLGKQLFNDKKLSKNNSMSCATCHDKNLAFTDGKVAFKKQMRNSPTLPYSVYQQSFFYDARAGSLEGQIIGVVTNKDEFHSNLEELLERVKTDSVYKVEFERLYGKITDFTIRNAMANYIRSLGDFSSKFDDNINGKVETLTDKEINGFNVFMGKGKCATCHFPPVFNGTIPPNFLETELESIGVPNLNKDELDKDLGRYNLFKTEERKHFFKTPTIRNIAKTAPYMHNGTYSSLEEVVDFYNKGGGIGLGYHVSNQTLPSNELKLSKEEIEDLIAFMNTLTDK